MQSEIRRTAGSAALTALVRYRRRDAAGSFSCDRVGSLFVTAAIDQPPPR
jgi:hypothetical protein